MRQIFNLEEIQKELVKKGEFLPENCLDTKSENKIGQELLKQGIKVVPQYKIKEWKFDFKLLEYPILIEIDGDVHNYKRRRHKDYPKDRYAQGLGFKVLRFSNHEVKHLLPIIVNEIKIIMNSVKRQPKIVWIYKMSIREQIVELVEFLCQTFAKIFKKST